MNFLELLKNPLKLETSKVEIKGKLFHVAFKREKERVIKKRRKEKRD